MEAQEEVIMGSKEQMTQIIKGKRTKRQRPQSPIPFAITTHSSSGDAVPGGGGGGGVDCSNNGDNDHQMNINNTNTITLSPTTSSTEVPGGSTTEEEEDMANCLILLAQGQSRDYNKIPNPKFNSRRYLDSDMGKAAAGYCVYECKTCNRTFQSFQALGGHRASHKKPKAMAEEKKHYNFASSDDEDGQFKNLSLQLGNHNRGLINCSINRISNKIHECSVCGAEFTSGQALGGHMRRHRGPIISNNVNMNTNLNNTTLSLTSSALEVVDHQEAIKKRQKNVLSLELDLNLPAPDDEPKFALSSKQQPQQQQQQQQSPLVFSPAPTLVDCHY